MVVVLERSKTQFKCPQMHAAGLAENLLFTVAAAREVNNTAFGPQKESESESESEGVGEWILP